MKKFWGMAGGDVTNYVLELVCYKWFSKIGSNLYFIQLLTNFI